MGDTAGGEGIAKRPHHGVLADQLGEDLRPVFAGKRGVACADRQRPGVRLAGSLGCLLLVFGFGHRDVALTTA
ncbi:MAG: hypothetical protein R3D01_06290 [Hyphomicrobiales bacterium]